MTLKVFRIAQAPSRSRAWFYVVAALVVALPVAVSASIRFWPTDVRFVASGAGLSVEGSSYGRSFDAASLDLAGARRLSGRDRAAFAPTLRTWGTATPGYAAGWFRLRDGQPALLFVTDWSRVVAIPTRSGSWLLLSPDDPPALLAALRSAGPSRTFRLAASPPDRGADLVFWLVTAFVSIGLAALLAALSRAGGRVRFELGGSTLRIRGDLYGRAIRRSDLKAGDASLIDIDAHDRFRRMLRVNGVGLPDYRSGWFRPKGGGRALLFVSDRARVVAVPTALGYTLLVSPEDPDAFLEALRAG